MKLIIGKSQLDTAPEQWLRKAGYAYIRDRRSGQDSFVRRLGSGFYPRFHMYFNQTGEQIIFNLHLDQKQPSYAGARSHSGEYDGENVAAEISRLKSLLTPVFSGGNGDSSDNLQVDKIARGEYDKDAKPEPRQPWWRRIF